MSRAAKPVPLRLTAPSWLLPSNTTVAPAVVVEIGEQLEPNHGHRAFCLGIPAPHALRIRFEFGVA